MRTIKELLQILLNIVESDYNCSGLCIYLRHLYKSDKINPKEYLTLLDIIRDNKPELTYGAYYFRANDDAIRVEFLKGLIANVDEDVSGAPTTVGLASPNNPKP